MSCDPGSFIRSSENRESLFGLHFTDKESEEGKCRILCNKCAFLQQIRELLRNLISAVLYDRRRYHLSIYNL